jgi:hypothetical protein
VSCHIEQVSAAPAAESPSTSPRSDKTARSDSLSG